MDPGSGKPRMMFSSAGAHFAPGLPEFWKNVRPVYDYNAQEFLGQSIAAIVHAGYLWILRMEPRVPGAGENYGPNDFRLLRLGLDGGKPVVIPLRSDVSPDMLTAEVDGKLRQMLPMINERSFTATPHGLVFALESSPSGDDTDYTREVPNWQIRFATALPHHLGRDQRLAGEERAGTAKPGRRQQNPLLHEISSCFSLP